MWEVVGYAAACLALVFLCALLPTVMGLPDVIAKYLSGRLGNSEMDKRLKDLEAQVQALRAPNHHESFAPEIPLGWDARLEAANAIGNADQRDEALEKVAQYASTAGEVAIMQTAIEGITDNDVRDETTSRCVASLARAGKHQEAITIASAISDNDLRDETLARLAIG